MAEVVFENNVIDVVVNSSDEVIVRGKRSGAEIRVSPMEKSLSISAAGNDMKIGLPHNGLPTVQVTRR